MKKIIICSLLFFALVGKSIVSPQRVIAADCSDKDWGVSGVSIRPDDFQSGTVSEINVSFNSSYLANGNYRVNITRYHGEIATSSLQQKSDSTTSLSFSINNTKPFTVLWEDNDELEVWLKDGPGGNARGCKLGDVVIRKGDLGLNCKFTISQGSSPACYYPGCLQKGKEVKIKIEGILNGKGDPYSGPVRYKLGQVGGGIAGDIVLPPMAKNGVATTIFMPNEADTYTIQLENFFTGNFDGCFFNKLDISSFCPADKCNDIEAPIGTGADTDPVTPFELCAQIEEGTPQRDACEKCAYGSVGASGNGKAATGIWTAVGCIPTNATSIVQVFIKIGLSIAGGVALLMILSAGFMLTASQGDSKRTNEAKELMTSAVIGLLFIIFSVTMLQFIGVTVLHIPGFGTT